MLNPRVFIVSAMSLTLVTSACSSANGAAPTTSIGSSVSTVAPTVTAVAVTVAATTVTVPLATVLPTVATTTTAAAAAPAAPVAKPSGTSSSSTTKDYEVVAGIFTTKTAAQSQIDKLTAAKFTGFSIKAVGAKFAAVHPDLTNVAATALAAKINTAGVATATTFHLTSTSTATTPSTTPSTTAASTSSSTNYEVVDGIYTTTTAAQAQIDKLTTAKFKGFTIKPITGKFAVVHTGLTKAEASALVTKIDAAGLGPSRIKAL